MVQTFLDDLRDHRRAQGQRYKLNFIVLFSIMAILSNSKSYRDISRFIKRHFIRLNTTFQLQWKQPPAYTTIRNIIQGLDSSELEACFRVYSQSLLKDPPQGEIMSIAADGKTLCGSFDNFEDKKARQILSFFETSQKLILAHICINEKSNEIPAVQGLLDEIELTGVFTMDALHCQKKLLILPKTQEKS